MRTRIASLSSPMDTAAAFDGFIYLADFDYGQLHSNVRPLVLGANYMGGLGAQADSRLLVGLQIHYIGPVYAPSEFPVYALVRGAWGNPQDKLNYNAVFPGAGTFDVFESESVFMPGTQSPPAAESPLAVPTGTRWFNFTPRGRFVRFGYQVEPGIGALSDYQLKADFWLVNDDGR